MRVVITVLLCLWAVIPVHSMADAPSMDPIPANNSDLDNMIAKANAVKAFAAKCAEFECPEFDCETAGQVLQALQEAQVNLRAMVYWLRKANDDHMAHFKSLVEQGIITGENMSRAQTALAYQEFLHNLGSALLDVASVTSYVKDIVEKVASGEMPDKSLNDLFDDIDGAYEALKDLESGISTLGSAATGESGSTPLGDMTPGHLGPLNQGELNNMKSTLSDMKSIIQDAIKNGKNWKETLRGGGLASAGQIVGRHLKAFSEGQIQERKEHIADLVRNLAAEDIAQANSYLNLQRVQNRRFKAEDALAAVIAAKEALLACITEHCGNVTLYNPRIPDFIQRGPNGEERESWGWALEHFNRVIPELAERIDDLPEIRDNCPGALVTPDDSTGAIHSPTGTIESDSSTWCTYGGSTTSVPLGGSTTAIPNGGTTPGGIIPTPGSTPDDDEDEPKDTPTTPAEDEKEKPPVTSVPRTPATPTTPEQSQQDEPVETDGPKIYVKAKKTVLEKGDKVKTQAVAGAMIKLNLSPPPALPVAGNDKVDTDFDQPPIQGLTGPDGLLELDLPPGTALPNGKPYEVEVDVTPQGGTIVHLDEEKAGTPQNALHAGLHEYITNQWTVNGFLYVVLSYPKERTAAVNELIGISDHVTYTEENYCRDKQEGPNDPYFSAKGSWGQKYDDQWAIKRVGFSDDEASAWNLVKRGSKWNPFDSSPSVIVAVIDTGLDWNHQDIEWENIWQNDKETADNGIDDDKNGYIDDVIGWNFWENNNVPWDRDGHGTFVAGVIAATQDNEVGIAGINPHAKIMVLKALNSFGHTRASYVAEAIIYAANNGAQIINVSVGGKELSKTEQDAIDFAHGKGLTIIVAAGNEGINTDAFGPAGAGNVITVSSTDFKDKRASFSNWGAAVDITAPGLDVLSLRARRTDLMQDIPGIEYEKGKAYVGSDNRYYRASGTSFSTPIVAGVASLLLANNPALTNDQIKRILTQSAEDVETPGKDQYTGYGVVDARKALQADPNFFIVSQITGVEVKQQGQKVVVQVKGTANANQFSKASIAIGAGEKPKEWKAVAKEITNPVTDDVLGEIEANALSGSKKWIIRLTTEHQNGQQREVWFSLDLG